MCTIGSEWSDKIAVPVPLAAVPSAIGFDGSALGSDFAVEDADESAGAMKSAVPLTTTEMTRVRKNFPESWMWRAAFATK